ncbi:hypothetical protein KR067_012980 [Drosophila pandora]|nr:hypothetical protein KR067_012980 [Drosophila pandora]
MGLRSVLGVLGVVIGVLAQDSAAVCCKAQFIRFKTNGFCETVDAIKHEYYAYCETTICADGKRIGKGRYCAQGRCNVFGCNCDGGCRQGDWERSFRNRYPKKQIWFI